MNTNCLGAKIKELRMKNNMTQSNLAEIVGISTRYVTEIERGYKIPKLETFINILNAINASADYVLQNDLNYISKKLLENLESKLFKLPLEHQSEIISIFDFIIENYKKSI